MVGVLCMWLLCMCDRAPSVSGLPHDMPVTVDASGLPTHACPQSLLSFLVCVPVALRAASLCGCLLVAVHAAPEGVPPQGSLSSGSIRPRRCVGRAAIMAAGTPIRRVHSDGI